MDASGNQKFRLVVDFRKLNEITIADKFPILNLDDILDKLGHAKYFTTFRPCQRVPSNRNRSRGHSKNSIFYKLRTLRMVAHAIWSLQCIRSRNPILAEHVGKICFVYLDDTIIFSSSLQEDIDR